MEKVTKERLDDLHKRAEKFIGKEIPGSAIKLKTKKQANIKYVFVRCLQHPVVFEDEKEKIFLYNPIGEIKHSKTGVTENVDLRDIVNYFESLPG